VGAKNLEEHIAVFFRTKIKKQTIYSSKIMTPTFQATMYL